MFEPTTLNAHSCELAELRPLPREVIEAYARDGFVRLKDVLSAELLGDYGREIARVVREWTVESFLTQIERDSGPEMAGDMARLYRKPREPGRSTYARAFTQRMNLWRRSEAIATLVHARRLAQLAADLMPAAGRESGHGAGVLCRGFPSDHAGAGR